MALHNQSLPERAMRHSQYTVTRQDVYRHAMQRLTTALRLPSRSRRCPPDVLLAVILLAAARFCSIVAAVRRLAGAPSDQTVRSVLAASLPGRDELERRLNRALVADLPRSLAGTNQPLAIDLTLRPYHGQPLADPAEVYRSKAKEGTSHFHAYATAYLVRHGRRFTLALTWVKRGEKLDGVLWRLLRITRRVGVRPRYLLLDRAFCSVDVIRYLQAARVPFLMPLPLRGRAAHHPDGPSGSRVFACARRSGWGRYTLTNSRGRRATVGVGVKCRNWRGERGRHGRQRLVYAFWGLTPSSVEWVRQTYRRRFGIETSYRQMNQARVTTCTRNPLVRLFLVGVALILRNIWVWWHWGILSTPRRGGRAIHLERLRFQTLLLWLQHVIEEQFGWMDETISDRPASQPVTS
jgi:Transposase DDE domain